MNGKITLITPPDFYETGNTSILLAHLTEEEQDAISQWLGKTDLKDNINIYFYNGEPNSTWILYAANRCEYKYINMDRVNYITQALSGYILSKTNFYYQTSDNELAEVYDHINTKRVENIEQFLESIFGDQQPNE
jgi:hypothetical protein